MDGALDRLQGVNPEAAQRALGNIEGRMTGDEMLQMSNEMLAAKAGHLPPEMKQAVADYNQKMMREQFEDDQGDMNYLVAGETYKKPEQAHKLEVTPAAVAAFQKAGIAPGTLQAQINMMRMDGVSEDEIKERFWTKAKQLDPSLLTPEEDEAQAEEELKEINNYIENVLHRDTLVRGQNSARYMVNRERARIPELEAQKAYADREYAAYSRGALGAAGVAFVEDTTAGFSNYALSKNEMEIQRKQAELYPVPTGLGHAGAWVNPYGAPGLAWRGSIKIGSKLLKESAPFWKTTLSAAIRAGGVDAVQTTTETNRDLAMALAESDVEKAQAAIYSIPGRLLENYFGALGGEVVGGMMYGMAYPVRAAMATQRTTDELFSLQGRKATLALMKAEAGTNAAALELIKGIEEGNIQTIQKIIATNPKLADTIAANGAKWAAVTKEKINAAAKPLHKQVSMEILEGSKMPMKAKQVAEGKPVSFNTSENGMLTMLGENVDETGTVYAEALKRGQEKMADVGAKQKLTRMYNNPGDPEAPGLLNSATPKEMEAFESGVTATTFPGFYEGSPELLMAEKKIAEDVAKLQKAAAGKMTPEQVAAEIKNIKNDRYMQGQHQYFKRILGQSGTDNIYDIDALKKLVDKTAKAGDITAGEGTAFGRFRKQLNTEILDQADPILAEVHNIDKVKDSLSDAYRFAKKLTPANVTEIEDYLIKDGMKMKPARLAAMKMSLLDTYRQAAVTGDTKLVQQIQEIIQSPQMRQYMNNGEWANMIKSVQPEVKALEYITAFSAASAKRAKKDIAADFAKLGLDVALNRQAAAINEVMMVMGKAKYNAGVAKKLQEWLTNPEKNWTQFSKIIESTNDFAERQMLSQILGQATQLTLLMGD